MKKGRHRRYEEARALKRTSDDLDRLLDANEQPCDECGMLPGSHKSWCALADDGLTGETAEDLFPS